MSNIDQLKPKSEHTNAPKELSLVESRLQRLEGKSEDRVWFNSKANSMVAVNGALTSLRKEMMKGSTELPAVLLMGETGTGKEGIGRMIHMSSFQGKGPWMSLSCLTPDLEAEIFGYERAQTIKAGVLELAENGSVFLDNIDSLNTDLQAKLLKAIQTRKFRRLGGNTELSLTARILASTEEDLDVLSKSGRFKTEFYDVFKANVIPVPPLRYRTEDILPMAALFAEKSFQQVGKKFEGFSSEAEDILKNYNWPGNVSELLNVVERAALLMKGPGKVLARFLVIQPTAASSGAGLTSVPTTTDFFSNPDMSYTALKKKWCDAFEKEYLMATLNRNEGNVSAAAREAKLDRSNFLRLLRRHGLKSEQYRKKMAA